MKILFATSEAGPFMRTGGLGDVSYALPLALTKMKQDVRVIMPLYEGINESFRQTMRFIGSKSVPLGWRQQYAGVFECQYNGVTYYFIDNEYYFKRKGLYVHVDPAVVGRTGVPVGLCAVTKIRRAIASGHAYSRHADGHLSLA